MAIYDFSKLEKNGNQASSLPQNQYSESIGVDADEAQSTDEAKGRFISSLVTRLFFLLLLLGDVLWTCYSLALLVVSLLGMVCSLGRVKPFHALKDNAWISLRRSLVCGVSLFIALFNPAFGIMIACTYFLMYDKTGIEEVVPSSLQEQFKEFFPKE